MSLDASAIRRGRVHGRYFRENLAQGGIDLVQIIPDLVTNADAAIAASERSHGRIEGVRAGRLVESWFFPPVGDEPYAFAPVRDEQSRKPRGGRLEVQNLVHFSRRG